MPICDVCNGEGWYTGECAKCQGAGRICDACGKPIFGIVAENWGGEVPDLRTWHYSCAPDYQPPSPEILANLATLGKLREMVVGETKDFGNVRVLRADESCFSINGQRTAIGLAAVRITRMIEE